MRRIKVFLDSSVIIAGLASASGGSHKVLALAELGVIASLHISRRCGGGVEERPEEAPQMS